MRPETGWLVFFYRKKDVVAWLISFGCWLGRLIRREPTPPPHALAYHVEGVVRGMEGVMLWGARAGSGFVPIPAAKRLKGLTPGKHFRVYAVDTAGWRDEIQFLVRQFHGTEYEHVHDVARVWRDGNRVRGPERLFCSEVWLRIERGWVKWMRRLDVDNTDPAEFEAALVANGVQDVTSMIVWEEE